MKLKLLTLVLISPSFLFSQTEITDRNINENYSLVNPAFTGIRGNKLSMLYESEYCSSCFSGFILGETKLKSGNHYLGASLGINRFKQTRGRIYNSTDLNFNYAKSYNLKNGNVVRAGVGLRYETQEYSLVLQDFQDSLISRNLLQARLGVAYTTKNWEYGFTISTINLPITDFIYRKPYYDLDFFVARTRIINSNLKLKSSLAIGFRFDNKLKFNGFSNLQYNIDAQFKEKLTFGMYLGGKSPVGGISMGYKFSSRFEMRANWDLLDLPSNSSGNSNPPLSINAIFRF